MHHSSYSTLWGIYTYMNVCINCANNNGIQCRAILPHSHAFLNLAWYHHFHTIVIVLCTHTQKSEVSWDFIDNDDDVMPQRTRDNHGTSCAGIIAMVKSNGVCGVGVAHDSQIAGTEINH